MKKYTIDLGEIKHKLKHNFSITLDDEIIKAQPACGCTNVSFSGKALKGSYEAVELTKDYINSPLFENKYLEVQKNIRITHKDDISSIVIINAKVVL